MQNRINQQIANRLTYLIQSKNLKVADLAKRAELSASNLYSILRGETTPTLYTLFMLCRGLQMPMSRFFIGMEIGESQFRGLEDMHMNEKIDELSPRNRKLMLEILDIFLKYP